METCLAPSPPTETSVSSLAVELIVAACAGSPARARMHQMGAQLLRDARHKKYVLIVTMKLLLEKNLRALC